MGTPAIASVVLIPFPFSDLSASKLRPAVVLADAEKGDWIICMITSNPYADARAVQLKASDFVEGGLSRESYVRPARLVTLNQTLMTREVGKLRGDIFDRIVDAVVKLFRG